MAYKKGSIKAKDVSINDDAFAFAIDTAGSWDGDFPEIGKGDFVVEVGSVDSDGDLVLVSRRYTGAVDHENAAELALSAFAERHDYETDDKGELLPVTNEMGTGIPAWVVEVMKVT